MKFIVKGKEYNCTLREWQGNGYGPDFLMDVAEDFLDGQELTVEEYNDFCDTFSTEVSKYNLGEYSEILGMQANIDKPYNFTCDWYESGRY